MFKEMKGKFEKICREQEAIKSDKADLRMNQIELLKISKDTYTYTHTYIKNKVFTDEI